MEAEADTFNLCEFILNNALFRCPVEAPGRRRSTTGVSQIGGLGLPLASELRCDPTLATRLIDALELDATYVAASIPLEHESRLRDRFSPLFEKPRTVLRDPWVSTTKTEAQASATHLYRRKSSYILASPDRFSIWLFCQQPWMCLSIFPLHSVSLQRRLWGIVVQWTVC